MLRMIAAPVEELERRAVAVREKAGDLREGRGVGDLVAEVVRGESLVGGGTFPDARLPTAILRVRAGAAADRWLAALRAHTPPVVARSKRGWILLDLRTITSGRGDHRRRRAGGAGRSRGSRFVTARGRRAVFADRDGTIIEDRQYVADPADVSLIAGSAEALQQLRRLGFALVTVTNQSGIGRGLYTLGDYERVAAEVDRQLAEAGVVMDGTYFCPDAPGGDPETTCRKPSPVMYGIAASDLGLDCHALLFRGRQEERCSAGEGVRRHGDPAAYGTRERGGEGGWPRVPGSGRPGGRGGADRAARDPVTAFAGRRLPTPPARMVGQGTWRARVSRRVVDPFAAQG